MPRPKDNMHVQIIIPQNFRPTLSLVFGKPPAPAAAAGRPISSPLSAPELRRIVSEMLD